MLCVKADEKHIPYACLPKHGVCINVENMRTQSLLCGFAGANVPQKLGQRIRNHFIVPSSFLLLLVRHLLLEAMHLLLVASVVQCGNCERH